MKDKLKTWLEKTGYPLELEVNKLVLSEGYICEKSQIYSDIETGAAREIDLAASLNVPHDKKDYFYEVQLLIECKKSEKPLIVLSSDTSPRERFEHLMGSEVIKSIKLDNGAAYFNLHDMDEGDRGSAIGQFSEKVISGYSMVQGFSKSDENIYKGIMGLAKANEYYREQYHKLAESDSSEQPWFRMQLPVMVVDSDLFIASLNTKGELSIDNAEWATLLIRMPWVMDRYDAERLCVIQVVRKDYFLQFLKAIRKLHTHILQTDSLNFKENA